MFVTLINDCKSENDIGRLKTRYSLLFPNTSINFVGVDSSLGINTTLEAGGNLVDVLDASEGKEGVVAVNVAPRGLLKDGENGSSFCYFWYKDTLVISTIKAYNLSLVKKLGLVGSVNLLDTKKVLDFAARNKLIDGKLGEYIAKSQFRSFDFQPRVAKWLVDNIHIPHTKLPIKEIANAPESVWLIDSFGNAKTTLLGKDIPLRGVPRKVKTNLGTFNFYEKLKDVPDGESAIYTGSSGLGDKRFLEIATQNRQGSAAKKLNLKVGKEVKFLNL